jgi:serine/threonine-protein kinase
MDLGVVDDGMLYLVMERVIGESVDALLHRGPIGVRRTLVLTAQVLDALAHAHGRGLIHRDLKPSNVMIATVGEPGSEREQVKLLDFGLVKLVGEAADEVGGESLTRTGVVFGTPEYMAPEQALGRAVDARTDLYALGVLLYEMLTGRTPFASRDPTELMRMHVSHAPPPLPDTPWHTPAIDDLVMRALRKRPDDRFSDAAAMKAALESAFVSIDHLPAGT